MLLMAGWVAGIALCAVLPFLPQGLYWLPLFPAAAIWRSSGMLRQGLLGVLALTAGLAYGGWRANLRLAQELPPAWAQRPIELVATVRGLPDPGEYGVRLALEVESTLTPGAALPAKVQVHDYLKRDWPPGSRWQLNARFKPRRGSANAFGFDAEQWLWSEGMLASGSAGKGRRRLEDRHDLLAWVDAWRARQVARIERVLRPGRESALVAALTVGAQQRVAREDWQLFSATGLTHIVSISGLHITMLAGLVAWLGMRALRFLPLARAPRVAAAWAALAAATGYALLAGFSVPTQRTLFMLAVGCGCLAWRRRLSAFQAWWLALAVVLLIDPFSVLAPGLWLSFGLVAALMFSSLARRAPAGRWRAVWDGQWAAGVASLAPLAAMFGGFPLLSPLANAWAIPFVSVLLTPWCLLAVALPWDSLLLPAGWLVQGFYLGVEWMAKGPAWHVAGAPWPVWGLAGLASAWLLAPRGVAGKPLAALLMLPMLAYRPAGPAPGAFRATVLDVGQGLAVLVQTAERALLFDTGAGEAGRVVLPQLRGLGVPRLDVLILSHHDSDHDGAAAGVLDGIPVSRLLAGQPQSFRLRGAQLCRQGESWVWDGVRFDILAPLAGVQGEDNAHSCVLQVAGEKQALMVSGDAPEAVENALAERWAGRLRSSVLIAGHHGSRTSSSDAWLAATQPQLAIVSAGFLNRYRHPHPQVLERLRRHGARVLRTDQDGALTIEFGPTLSWRCLRQDQPRYWRARGACGDGVTPD
ncbi:DNA internalization-related competence protein ComEC/Rec2 [Chromobacterium sp. IIBBL 290-4]|uniref:DNA internalization-related competence protein ComEC/Rec2 n=1 Tax=Chromobacterium sp. IIBBL 290-4 TaxID=2953890 RepID=UPI0020B7855D|nr:DNA internalization-related competence protein ComEC/Rec2 [Chromobacterium sp. IIBBL 290-4]UTH76156.1 DNA internalization-related competence protein ComEC/Rec2 [Chromobacterium sp. IIBBL 290-4]